MFSNYVSLLRIRQWTKNLFIFLPLFFGGEFLNLEKQTAALFAFLSFSFMASAIYCFNDIMDLRYDQLHPLKKNRPIASGKVSKRTAYILMLLLIVTSLGLQVVFGGASASLVIPVLLAYFALNLLYTKSLKYLPIIDVFILSLGFVLRIIAGGFATHVPISHWIIIMTFLLALFLSFAKRLDDLILYEQSGTISRKNINRYNKVFLNQTISIIATIIILSYLMYTVSSDVIARFNSTNIYVTAVFVLAGILRYLQLTIVDEKSGNPSELLLTDRFIQACVLAWIGTFIYIVYL